MNTNPVVGVSHPGLAEPPSRTNKTSEQFTARPEPSPPDVSSCPDIHSFSALLDAKACSFLDPNKRSLEDLPPEILCQIASHFDQSSKIKVALTSRYLKDALWDAVRHTQTSVRVSGRDLAAALEKFPNTERVTVSGQLTGDDIAKIPDLNRVRCIGLSRCTEPTIPDFDTLAQKFSNLTTVRFNRTSVRVSGRDLGTVLQKFPNTERVNLTGPLTVNDIARIPDLNRVNCIDVSRCPVLSVPHLDALSQKCCDPNLFIIFNPIRNPNPY